MTRKENGIGRSAGHIPSITHKAQSIKGSPTPILPAPNILFCYGSNIQFYAYPKLS